MKSALDDLLLEPLRCPVRWRGLHCSLEEGHDGRHEAYFKDQNWIQPTDEEIEEVVEALEVAVEEFPCPPAPTYNRVATDELKKGSSHHKLHPGGWMPEARLVGVSFPEEPEDESTGRYADFLDALSNDDLLPVERAYVRRRSEAA